MRDIYKKIYNGVIDVIGFLAMILCYILIYPAFVCWCIWRGGKELMGGEPLPLREVWKKFPDMKVMNDIIFVLLIPLRVIPHRTILRLWGETKWKGAADESLNRIR